MDKHTAAHGGQPHQENVIRLINSGQSFCALSSLFAPRRSHVPDLTAHVEAPWWALLLRKADRCRPGPDWRKAPGPGCASLPAEAPGSWGCVRGLDLVGAPVWHLEI